MIPCSVRDYRECDCGPNQCKCAPPAPLDIQVRLADINSRARKAQQDRDRYFWNAVTAICLIALVLVIAFVSIPAGMRADHQLALRNQEQVALRR